MPICVCASAFEQEMSPSNSRYVFKQLTLVYTFFIYPFFIHYFLLHLIEARGYNTVMPGMCFSSLTKLLSRLSHVEYTFTSSLLHVSVDGIFFSK